MSLLIFAYSTSIVSIIIVAKQSTCDHGICICREYFSSHQENVLGVANLYFVSFSLTNQQNLLKIFTAGA